MDSCQHWETGEKLYLCILASHTLPVLAEYLGSIKQDLWYFQEHLLYSAGAERNGFMQLFSAWQVIALRFPEVLGLQGKGLCAPKY